MGDLLGSPRVAPFFVVFFSFESNDLSHFIFCERRMSRDQDKEKESKSGLPAMFTSKLPKCPYERVLAPKIGMEVLF